MKTIEYKTIDKSSWKRGPWDDEPDKVQWTDKATGLPCLAVRQGFSGHWCGYVGVSGTHPNYGADYDRVEADAHGGLTFASKCSPGDESTSICHIVEHGEDDDVWWFGFDCAHLGDLSPNMSDHRGFYRDLGYVKNQIKSLTHQLERAICENKGENIL